MRDAFIKALTKLACFDDKIVLLTGDVGFKIFDSFCSNFPNRFFNVGIAEANMVSMASGMALKGFKPYVYSMVPFVSMRACEQIRHDVAYHNRNVKIIGIGAGFSYGHNGTSHHGIEDVAIFNAIPNMKILCPADPKETTALINASYLDHCPTYIRLGRAGEKDVHLTVPNISIGQSLVFSVGRDVTIFSTGNMLVTALEVQKILKDKNIDCGVVSFPTVKPLDTGMIQEVCFSTHCVIALEEHNEIGGFGSSVARYLATRGMYGCRFFNFGIPDQFTSVSGDQQYLRKMCGLDSKTLSKKIEIVLSGRCP